MSGAGSEAVGKGLMFVAQFRIVRILLWIVVSLILLMALMAHMSGDAKFSGDLWRLGLVIGLFPLYGALKDRKKTGPSPVRWFLIRLAFGAFIMGSVSLVLWLMKRGRKKEEALPPPTPEEVDRLVLTEQREERAA